MIRLWSVNLIPCLCAPVAIILIVILNFCVMQKFLPLLRPDLFYAGMSHL
jgi:hypothetical protein